MSLFRYGPHDDAELEAEIMASDGLRAAIVGAAFLAAAAFVAVVGTQASKLAETPLAFLVHFPYAATAVTLGLLAAYEAGYRLVGRALNRHSLKLPLPARLANTLVEVSVPTFLLAMLSTVVVAPTALNLPPQFLYFLFLTLSILRIDPRLALFAGVAAGAEYAGLAWFLLRDAGAEGAGFVGVYASKGAMLAVCGALGAFVAYQIRKRLVGLLRSRELQSRTAAIFGQHVSPAVMEKLLTQKTSHESETRHVTMLFLDIRNFTTFSETKSPDEVVDYLNGLFGFMVDAVNDHHGIINKFLGDGFMAVFGAPLDDGQSELNAVRAALAISARLDVHREQTGIGTRIGIGLHSGRAVTGNVGSSQRQEYTIIGDVVNLASRIESQTKALSAEILASREAWDAARRADGTLEGTPVGAVRVKGREAPVELVRIR